MDTAIDFTHNTKYYVNTNQVELSEEKGIYHFSSMFAAKVGEKSSSFNYSGFALSELEKDLFSYGSIKRILDQTTNQIETKSVEGKFTGDIIVTPDCLPMFVYQYVGTYLSDMPIISGTSILKDKLNEEVASPMLTLESKPRTLADGYMITNDGHVAEDMAVIENGVLKTFMLSLYGSNKSKNQKAKNTGGCYCIQPGNTPLNEMIKSVKRGVLVCRVSGGSPNNNGDLSVVLKNSFYIEDGEIKYPLTETSITTNLKEAFQNIKDISSGTVDYGNGIYPYLKISDVLISGK